MADYEGLKIIEVSDPSNPVLVSSFEFRYTNSVSTIEIRGKLYALVSTDYRGLLIIEVSDPSHPALVGSINTDV